MTRTLRVLCLIATAVISGSAQLGAQVVGSKAGSKKTVVTNTLPEFAIDSDAKFIKLPPATVSPDVLLRSLEVKPKSEFETRDQYAERLERVLTQLSYAIRLPVSQSTEADDCRAAATYDADSAMLSISLPADQEDFGPDLEEGVQVSCSETVLGTYVGRNGFNVKARVTRLRRELTIIAAPGFPSFAARLRIPMAPDAAKRHKPNLGILAIVSPAVISNEIIRRTSIRREPQIDSPRDVTEYKTFINSSPIRFVVYNRGTGQILFNGPIP